MRFEGRTPPGNPDHGSSSNPSEAAGKPPRLRIRGSGRIKLHPLVGQVNAAELGAEQKKQLLARAFNNASIALRERNGILTSTIPAGIDRRSPQYGSEVVKRRFGDSHLAKELEKFNSHYAIVYDHSAGHWSVLVGFIAAARTGAANMAILDSYVSFRDQQRQNLPIPLELKYQTMRPADRMILALGNSSTQELPAIMHDYAEVDGAFKETLEGSMDPTIGRANAIAALRAIYGNQAYDPTKSVINNPRARLVYNTSVGAHIDRNFMEMLSEILPDDEKLLPAQPYGDFNECGAYSLMYAAIMQSNNPNLFPNGTGHRAASRAWLGEIFQPQDLSLMRQVGVLKDKWE